MNMFEKINFENNNQTNMQPKIEGEKTLREKKREELEKAISNIVDGIISNSDNEAAKWLIDTEEKGDKRNFRRQLKDRVYFAVRDLDQSSEEQFFNKVGSEVNRILEKVLYRNNK